MVHHATRHLTGRNPLREPMLTLGQAARLAVTSKTTLTRAIKAGLSATRNEDGSCSIEPSELARVYEIQPATLEILRLHRRFQPHVTVWLRYGSSGWTTIGSADREVAA